MQAISIQCDEALIQLQAQQAKIEQEWNENSRILNETRSIEGGLASADVTVWLRRTNLLGMLKDKLTKSLDDRTQMHHDVEMSLVKQISVLSNITMLTQVIDALQVSLLALQHSLHWQSNGND
jgi:hypothetical protein